MSTEAAESPCLVYYRALVLVRQPALSRCSAIYPIMRLVDSAALLLILHSAAGFAVTARSNAARPALALAPAPTVAAAPAVATHSNAGAARTCANGAVMLFGKNEEPVPALRSSSLCHWLAQLVDPGHPEHRFIRALPLCQFCQRVRKQRLPPAFHTSIAVYTRVSCPPRRSTHRYSHLSFCASHVISLFAFAQQPDAAHLHWSRSRHRRLACAIGSTLWTLSYARLGRRLGRKPETKPSDAASSAMGIVKFGVTLNMIGMALCILSAFAITGTLAAKALTMSQAATLGVAASPVQAIDVLIVQANTNTLAAHAARSVASCASARAEICADAKA